MNGDMMQFQPWSRSETNNRLSYERYDMIQPDNIQKMFMYTEKVSEEVDICDNNFDKHCIVLCILVLTPVMKIT